jgi:hypothetical protein
LGDGGDGDGASEPPWKWIGLAFAVVGVAVLGALALTQTIDLEAFGIGAAVVLGFAAIIATR